MSCMKSLSEETITTSAATRSHASAHAVAIRSSPRPGSPPTRQTPRMPRMYQLRAQVVGRSWPVTLVLGVEIGPECRGGRIEGGQHPIARKLRLQPQQLVAEAEHSVDRPAVGRRERRHPVEHAVGDIRSIDEAQALVSALDRLHAAALLNRCWWLDGSLLAPLSASRCAAARALAASTARLGDSVDSAATLHKHCARPSSGRRAMARDAIGMLMKDAAHAAALLSPSSPARSSKHAHQI